MFGGLLSINGLVHESLRNLVVILAVLSRDCLAFCDAHLIYLWEACRMMAFNFEFVVLVVASIALLPIPLLP